MTLRLLTWLTRIVCAASGHPYTRPRFAADWVECHCRRYAKTNTELNRRG